MQLLASAGTAAAGHLTELPAKPTSAGVTTMPRDAATFSTQTLPSGLASGAPVLVSFVVNLPPKKGGVPAAPASEVAGA